MGASTRNTIARALLLLVLLPAPLQAQDESGIGAGAGITPGASWIDLGDTLRTPDDGRDVHVWDDSPSLILRDTTDNTAFALHHDSAETYAGLTLWAGTDAGNAFLQSTTNPTLHIQTDGDLFLPYLHYSSSMTARCLEKSATGQVTLAAAACGTGSGGNSFETIAVPAGASVVADSSTDTLTITETSFLTITGTAATDTIDITQVTTDLGTDGLIAANAVALSTDTTGNYLADGAGTTGEIEVSGGGSEGATLTIGIVSNPDFDGDPTITDDSPSLCLNPTSGGDACLHEDPGGAVAWFSLGTSHGWRVRSDGIVELPSLTAAACDVKASTIGALYCGTDATGTGSGSPAGSGSELQYRVDGSTFGAVTSSSVSGAAITLGGDVVLSGSGLDISGTDTAGGSDTFGIHFNPEQLVIRNDKASGPVGLSINAADDSVHIGEVGFRPTSVTVYTDGTGDGEVNLPDSSIGDREVSISLMAHGLIESPGTGDDALVQWKFPRAITLRRVTCSTDTGTVTIQLDERVESTPNTAGTDVLTAALVCNTTTDATTGFDNAGIAANALLSLDVDAVASSPTKLRIHVAYSLD